MGFVPHPPSVLGIVAFLLRPSPGAGHQHRSGDPRPYPGVPGRQRRVQHPRLHHGLPVPRAHGFSELASRYTFVCPASLPVRSLTDTQVFTRVRCIRRGGSEHPGSRNRINEICVHPLLERCERTR